MSELKWQGGERAKALELAVELFKCGDIGADDIVKYAEQFHKFLTGSDKAVSEPGWDYFCDEGDPYSDTAYFRRIKGNDTSTSQFLGGSSRPWRSVASENLGREYMEQAGYWPIPFEELPTWVKAIS